MLNRCYVCNVVGHIASECPVNNANMLSNAFDWWDGRFCFLCGYRGHIYFNCPANIFLNLGSSCTIATFAESGVHMRSATVCTSISTMLRGPGERLSIKFGDCKALEGYQLDATTSTSTMSAHLEWPTIPCLFCRETGHASVECSTWLVNFPEGPVADALDRRVHRQIFGDPTGEYYFHWDGRQETRRIMYSKKPFDKAARRTLVDQAYARDGDLVEEFRRQLYARHPQFLVPRSSGPDGNDTESAVPLMPQELLSRMPNVGYKFTYDAGGRHGPGEDKDWRVKDLYTPEYRSQVAAAPIRNRKRAAKMESVAGIESYVKNITLVDPFVHVTSAGSTIIQLGSVNCGVLTCANFVVQVSMAGKIVRIRKQSKNNFYAISTAKMIILLRIVLMLVLDAMFADTKIMLRLIVFIVLIRMKALMVVLLAATEGAADEFNFRRHCSTDY
uniref:CCHC-type domain-containing protein n=1 Tax=Ditylenchus dipsaci TaxID=166011 RepID=A0A915DTH8_9BILA